MSHRLALVVSLSLSIYIYISTHASISLSLSHTHTHTQSEERQLNVVEMKFNLLCLKVQCFTGSSVFYTNDKNTLLEYDKF